MAGGLSEKEERMLRAVIEIYVDDGVPVSSKRIKQAMGMVLSTASIRNVLAALETHGLLMKPHTSAGRVPTDEGYRYFVDAIEPDNALCHEISSRFRDEVKKNRDVSAIMSIASRVLGSLSRNFAVVYGSAVQQNKVNRIYLVALDGARIHVIVHLIPRYERTVEIHTEKHFGPETTGRVEALINRLIHDKTIDEAMETLDKAVRDNITDEGIIMREVAANRGVIFSEPPAGELYFENREYLLEQPELSDPVMMQGLLRLLHNREHMTSILSRRVEERTIVTIGSENEDKALKHFSLVTSGYRMMGSRGVLGIIGPRRMKYDFAYFLVGSIAKELHAIGEEYS